MLVDIKAALKSLRRHRVRVHRDNILEATLRRSFGTELQGFGHLPFINAIEQVAVMN